MARSLIYFYPTSDVPITMKNVVAAVKACHAPPPDLPHLLQLTREAAAERVKRFRPTAFLSVPYILSTLAEDLDGEGINMLQGMEFVSTGGAPLDTLIGDAMVQRGIRLVSRLGSSECGCKSPLCCVVISLALTYFKSCSALIAITKQKRTGSFCETTVRMRMRYDSRRRMLDQVGLGDTRWSLHPIGQAW